MPCSLAIVGPGRVGLDLAAWAVGRGLHVHLFGRSQEHVQERCQSLFARWRIALEGGRIQPHEHQARGARLHAAGAPAPGMGAADIVFEALPEDPDVKVQAWRALKDLVNPEALLLTGSSSLSLGGLRQRAKLPHLLGFHLFLPLSRMGVVELVSDSATPAPLLDRACGLAHLLGKHVAHVRDQPGFAASRLALAQGLEAMRILESGAATADSIDMLMTLGYGHPCGPLELSDRIGLDLRLAIADHLFRATGLEAFRPPDLLRRLVEDGATGRAAGRGFHRWEGGKRLP